MLVLSVKGETPPQPEKRDQGQPPGAHGRVPVPGRLEPMHVSDVLDVELDPARPVLARLHRVGCIFGVEEPLVKELDVLERRSRHEQREGGEERREARRRSPEHAVRDGRLRKRDTGSWAAERGLRVR